MIQWARSISTAVLARLVWVASLQLATAFAADVPLCSPADEHFENALREELPRQSVVVRRGVTREVQVVAFACNEEGGKQTIVRMSPAGAVHTTIRKLGIAGVFHSTTYDGGFLSAEDRRDIARAAEEFPAEETSSIPVHRRLVLGVRTKDTWNWKVADRRRLNAAAADVVGKLVPYLYWRDLGADAPFIRGDELARDTVVARQPYQARFCVAAGFVGVIDGFGAPHFAKTSDIAALFASKNKHVGVARRIANCDLNPHDGCLAAVDVARGEIELIDAKGNVFRRIPLERKIAADSAVTARFTENGKSFVVLTENTSSKFQTSDWIPVANDSVRQWGAVRSSDGNRGIVRRADGSIWLVDPVERRDVKRLNAGDEFVDAVFSPNDQRLVLRTRTKSDGTPRLSVWNVVDGQPVADLSPFDAGPSAWRTYRSVKSVVWSPESDWIVASFGEVGSFERSGAALAWRAENGRCRAVLTDVSTAVLAGGGFPNGPATFITGLADGRIFSWQLPIAD